MMKMKELSEETGVNSATIRYYITQGLLPKPVKTHKNMAYYDERYISLINLIKKLQKEYFLPLNVIKQAIREAGYDRAPYMTQEIIDKLVGKDAPWPAEPSPMPESMTKSELMKATGLSMEDFEAAEKEGFLVKDKNGNFDRENIQVAMLLGQLRSHLTAEKGFSTEFFITHFRTLGALVNKEFAIFMNSLKNGTLSKEEIDNFAAKSLDLFHRLAPLLHKRLINKKIKESLSL